MNGLAVVAGAALVIGVAAAGVLAPLRRGAAPEIEPAPDLLLERRRQLLRERRDLDEAEVTGSIDPASYQRARSAIARRWANTSEPPAEVEGRPKRRTAVWAIAVVLVAVALVPVARAASSQRDAGAPITGDITAGTPAPTASSSIADLRTAVQAAPDDVHARLALARAEFDRGSLDVAARQYMVVLQFDHGNSEARARLGFILAASGKPQRGMTVIESVLRDDPGFREAEMFRAVILLRYLDRPASAATALRRLVATAQSPAERQETSRLLRQALHAQGATG